MFNPVDLSSSWWGQIQGRTIQYLNSRESSIPSGQLQCLIWHYLVIRDKRKIDKCFYKHILWTHITKITRFNQCKIDLHAISRVTAATTGFEMLLFDACELNFETSFFPSSWSHFWSWYYSVSRFVFVVLESDCKWFHHQTNRCTIIKTGPNSRLTPEESKGHNNFIPIIKQTVALNDFVVVVVVPD